MEDESVPSVCCGYVASIASRCLFVAAWRSVWVAAAAVACVGGTVGKRTGPHARGSLRRVRVKIIIDVNAIDRIALGDIGDDADGMLAHAWFTGVEPQSAAV